jgi:nucleoid-associated protein YgaU
MLLRIRSILVVFLAPAAWNPAHGQQARSDNSESASFLIAQADMTTNSPTPGAADSSAPAGDEVTRLQTENATLRKEVADAARTIARLQAQLAQAGISHQTVTASPEPASPAGTPDATDTSAPAPAGPQKALPLDATNANATASAPGAAAADAGPGRSYTVVKGDSLWRIAHQMYPHDTLNGEDKIRDANKDVFNGKFLQPGQVLVIPQ